MINQKSSLEFSHFPVMLNEVKISSPSNKENLSIAHLEVEVIQKKFLNFLILLFRLLIETKKQNLIAKNLEKKIFKDLNF